MECNVISAVVAINVSRCTPSLYGIYSVSSMCNMTDRMVSTGSQSVNINKNLPYLIIIIFVI